MFINSNTPSFFMLIFYLKWINFNIIHLLNYIVNNYLFFKWKKNKKKCINKDNGVRTLSIPILFYIRFDCGWLLDFCVRERVLFFSSRMVLLYQYISLINISNIAFQYQCCDTFCTFPGETCDRTRDSFCVCKTCMCSNDSSLQEELGECKAHCNIGKIVIQFLILYSVFIHKFALHM